MLTDEPEAIAITKLRCQRKTVSFMVKFFRQTNENVSPV